ncbi:PepSY domain-containing protein [Mucilaginibacter sp. UR6-1]|uniref:PepSY-associated TM helix domain-containing protein n=1 Tax=Mucilaginibacter sp. UR6-1 TaxID=1435643 RepID=UPI001E53FC25|nr:PepSY-associated TM helix domain-containing protein [Mucilaginibacter sp. UR6-1]MCC8407424.1 PepSY domain-containing protein [Mucilaginibacter sp. UR6-1]
MIWKRVKAVAAWLHLWVGLVTGIIVVLVSVTGCILVFEDELFDTFHRDLVEVKQTGPARPVSELLVIAQAKLGKKKPVSDIRINEADHSYIFSASKINKKDKIQWWSYFSQFKYKDDVYINQYTGEVLGVIDVRYEFFNITEQLHRQLLLVKPVGSVIIGSCILLFLLMMITGFMLWLPKNLKQLKKNLSVKWNARWKRVNYDLHNSFGFYVLPIAMIIAITGLVWSFKWWEDGIYRILGSPGKVELVRKAPEVSTLPPAVNQKHTLDNILAHIQHEVSNNYLTIGLNLPEKDEPTLMAFVYHKNRSDGWRNMSYFYFDMRNGKQFDKLIHSQKPLGLKWRNSNKDIHTGRIYGLGTQLLAFLASLVCASLPITGFMIWWGKRNKKSKKPLAKRAAPVRRNLAVVKEDQVV